MIWPHVSYLQQTSLSAPELQRVKPQMHKDFASSACVMFTTILLVRASHMTMSSISVGGAWTKAQNRRKVWALVFGKSLRQHEIQKMVREGKEFLVGSCTPGPEQNTSRWTPKVGESRKKEGSITLSKRFVCAEITLRGVLQSYFQGMESLGSHVQRKVNS